MTDLIGKKVAYKVRINRLIKDDREGYREEIWLGKVVEVGSKTLLVDTKGNLEAVGMEDWLSSPVPYNHP